MGELVLAKQGVHEAFGAADKMISESIKAVIRLVVRPGLINVGLDDLMSALRTTRSRCLFGSGIADGKDRASKALRNALSSPLLDQGSLLKEAQTVLVHLSGGESLTLFEIELLMQNLQKYVPEKAHVLFGAAIDPAMGDNLSITLISALPEDALTGGDRDSMSTLSKSSVESGPSEVENAFSKIDKPKPESPAPEPATEETTELLVTLDLESPGRNQLPEPRSKVDFSIGEHTSIQKKSDPVEEPEEDPNETVAEPEREERPFAEPELIKPEETPEPESMVEPEEEEILAREEGIPEPYKPAPKARTREKPLWGKSRTNVDEDPFSEDISTEEAAKPAPKPTTELKLDSKKPGSQSELAFESAPRGRFEGENPNVVDGEDLDLPPFLRKKKS
jgi:cell division protein FtsZ